MLALSLICALTLIWSGIAKLRTSGSARATLLGLGLPTRGWLLAGATVIPFVELLLGVSWLFLPSRWALVSAGFAALLFLGFLLIVIRAYRARGRQAACACFGSVRSVDPMTIARNAALTLMSATAVALGSWSLARLGDGASVVVDLVNMLGSAATAPSAVAAIALTIAWFVVALAQERAPQLSTVRDNRGAEQPRHEVYDEYGGRTVTVGDKEVFVPKQAERQATFIDPSGEYVAIEKVANERGSLVVFTQPNCRACVYLKPKIEAFRAQISPMSVEVVELTQGLAEAESSGAWRDPSGMAAALLEVPTYPAALVLLQGGAIPVGPVFGPDAIIELVEELEEVLAAAQQEAAAAQAGEGSAPNRQHSDA